MKSYRSDLNLKCKQQNVSVQIQVSSHKCLSSGSITDSYSIQLPNHICLLLDTEIVIRLSEIVYGI